MINLVKGNFSSSCPILYLDKNGLITSANQYFIDTVKCNLTNIVGLNMFQLFIFEDNISINIFIENINTNKIWCNKLNFFIKDNPYFFYGTFIPISNSNDNSVTCVVLYTMDNYTKDDLMCKINDLSKENFKKDIFIEEYKKLLNRSVAIVRLKDRNIIYINKSYKKIFGYSEDEILGKDVFFTVYDSPEMNKIAKYMKNKLLTYGYVKGNLECLRKDGKKVYIQAYFMIMQSINNDDYTLSLGVLNDVTEVYNAQKELEDIQKDVIFAMGSISEGRSRETGNHVKRVAEYSYLLAKLYGLSEDKANLLKIASPMHDIGKIVIPDSILHKHGKLTDSEFEIMKTHAMRGYEMLSFSNRKIIKVAAQIALTHHEWWNGNGYPNALSGYNIPIFGRITAVADVFDALSNDRCYKKAWPINEVVSYMESQRYKQFESALVNLLIDNLDSFLKIKLLFNDEV